MDAEDLLRLVLVLVVVWIVIEIVVEVLELAVGALAALPSLLGVVVAILIILWLLDHI